jgi:RNA polymerase sigma-70 factor (ECF subfamily)
VRDAGEAEDVTQDAFIKAYRALPGFRGESAFYTWLYRIGINTAKNHLLANKRRPPTSTPFDAEDSESFDDAGLLQEVSTPENELMSKQVVDVVQASLQQLPEDLRSALTLREIEGLSYEEIASVMNCPVGTVRSRIFRAREAVADNLRPLLETNKGNRW